MDFLLQALASLATGLVGAAAALGGTWIQSRATERTEEQKLRHELEKERVRMEAQASLRDEERSIAKSDGQITAGRKVLERLRLMRDDAFTSEREESASNAGSLEYGKFWRERHDAALRREALELSDPQIRRAVLAVMTFLSQGKGSIGNSDWSGKGLPAADSGQVPWEVDVIDFGMDCAAAAIREELLDQRQQNILATLENR